MPSLDTGWARHTGGTATPPRRHARWSATVFKTSACIASSPRISVTIPRPAACCRNSACAPKAASASTSASGINLWIQNSTVSFATNGRRERKMPDAMAVQVTIYLNEADQWHHRPLHMEILNYLRKENVYAATAIHCVAGFLGRQRVETAHLVETGGKLPVIIIFVDTDEHVSRVLPTLKEMAAHRLIVRENVVLEQGSLD